MHIPEPEHGLYLTLVSPWGAIPEYSSKLYNPHWGSSEIPAFPGCPFRIAYAVSRYIDRESPLFDNMPVYLSFEVHIEGQLAGKPLIIDQRNKEECTGYLPGLYKGAGDEEAQWFTLYHQIFEWEKVNAKGDGGLMAGPSKVEVKVYRCSIQERKMKRKKGKKKSKKTKVPAECVGVQCDESQDSDVESGKHCTLDKKQLDGRKDLKKLGVWGTALFDPKFKLLSTCDWWYRSPSLASSQPNTPIIISEIKDLPVYSKGSKSSFLHPIGPPPERRWDKRRAHMILFQARMKAGSPSPLRNFFLPEDWGHIEEEAASGPLKKITNLAQNPPVRDSDLDLNTGNPCWQIGISRTGRVTYSKSSPRRHSNRIVTTTRPRRPYIHVHLPPGWEERCINHNLYFFDHNTGSVQRSDPRTSVNTVAPTNPSPSIASLQTIRKRLKEHLKMKYEQSMGVEISSADLYQKYFQKIIGVYGGNDSGLQGSLKTTRYIEGWLQQNFPAADLHALDTPAGATANNYLAFRQQMIAETLEAMGWIKVWVGAPLRNLRNILERLRDLFGKDTVRERKRKSHCDVADKGGLGKKRHMEGRPSGQDEV